MAQQSRFTKQGFVSWRTAEIASIDQQITQIHRKLRRLERIEPLSAASWQDAWDKHPDLHAVECDLFRQRGDLQRA